VHGIDKTNDHTVENKEQSKMLFEDFLANAPNIDPRTIGVIEVHRLPQHEVRFDDHKVTRPIVVNFISHLIKLKSFVKPIISKNITKKGKKINIRARKVYITDHLPKIFAN